MQTTLRNTALTSIAVLFLLGGTNIAFAATPHNLNTTTVGGVSNLGTQIYTVNGGQVAFAMIGGQQIDPTTATISYNFVATQQGLNTFGLASLALSGTTPDGMSASVTGTFSIYSAVPAAELPYGCSTNCQSELPFSFVATSSNVQMTVEGTTQTIPETLQIESPYFNPWGAPIVLASADGAIVIAATYTVGTISWSGTQLGGAMYGTLGKSAVSGMFNMTSSEQENLVTGTATDSGTMTFSKMTPSSLNAVGSYSGTSTIPMSGAADCSSATGIPGTCTETGFQSIGTFNLGSITGNYSTAWGVPALGFTASVTGNATHTNQGNH